MARGAGDVSERTSREDNLRIAIDTFEPCLYKFLKHHFDQLDVHADDAALVLRVMATEGVCNSNVFIAGLRGGWLCREDQVNYLHNYVI